METIALHAALDDSSWRLQEQPQVLILGHFDGIHEGHVQVIRHALNYGKQHQLPVGLMTFHPHPKGVFGKPEYERFITPLSEKKRILSQLGLDRLYVVQFDLSFAKVTAQQFAEAICRMKVKHVVVGFDYRFGHGGEGTAQLLQEWGKGCFTVDIIPAHNDVETAVKVSSTRIRESLLQGDVVNANRLLGRTYIIRGEVVHGDARGRTMGFPTANVRAEEAYVIPANGVYAVKVLVHGTWHDGVLNIGLKPTFKTGETVQSVEAHLFDFDQDIYGETVTVALMSYIRPERKFSSIQELIAQITADSEEARQRLSTMDKAPTVTIGV